jgi:hypothetical protein
VRGAYDQENAETRAEAKKVHPKIERRANNVLKINRPANEPNRGSQPKQKTPLQDVRHVVLRRV